MVAQNKKIKQSVKIMFDRKGSLLLVASLKVVVGPVLV